MSKHRLITAALAPAALLLCALAHDALGQSYGFDRIVINEMPNFVLEDGRPKLFSGGVDIVLPSQTPDEAPLQLRAQRFEFEYSGPDADGPSVVRLIGNVHVRHATQGAVTAGQAVWRTALNEVVFTESPLWKQDGMELQMDTVKLNLDTGTVEGVNVKPGSVIDFGPLARAAAPPPDPLLLGPGDVRDWPGFIARLQSDAQAAADTPGKRLVELLPADTRQRLVALTPEQVRAGGPELERAFVGQFNDLLASTALYAPGVWPLTPEAEELAADGLQQLSREELVWFNRTILAAAFPDHLPPPPAMEAVE